jgi:hypothetical protein
MACYADRSGGEVAHQHSGNIEGRMIPLHRPLTIL